MRIIERNGLRIGYVISYVLPGNNLVLHGTILHLGLGLAARNGVWIRCLDGTNQGHVECVLLEQVKGVIPYANR